MPILSESVWFEQVDTALINYIQGIVKLPNANGILTPVPVKVRKPDEDFKVEEYPCITLYNLYSLRDEVRYCPDMVAVERDTVNNRIVLEKSAIPYNLYYQLDFWSRLQSEMNDMTRKWLGNHPDRCFNLPVKDLSGQNRESFVLMTDDLKKSDFLTDTKRTFHSMITYRVWVEIDEKIRVEESMVTSTPTPNIQNSVGGT